MLALLADCCCEQAWALKHFWTITAENKLLYIAGFLQDIFRLCMTPLRAVNISQAAETCQRQSFIQPKLLLSCVVHLPTQFIRLCILFLHAQQFCMEEHAFQYV